MNAHPAAELFPLTEGEEFQRFVEDIRARGLQHPIVTLDGQILDGRNRERACAEAGVEPRYVEVDLNGSSPVEFVMGENQSWRTLTASQKAAIAVEAMDLLAAEAKERQAAAGRSAAPGRPAEKGELERAQVSGRARELAAQKFGIAHAQVGRAIALRKHAPELLAEVKTGLLTIGAALRKAGLDPNGTRDSARKPATTADFTAVMRDLTRLRERWNDETFSGLPRGEAERILKALGENPEFLLHLRQLLERRARKLVLAGLSS